MAKVSKTNAMRILDKEKIPYEIKTYEYDESDLSGVTAAEKMGVDPNTIFKTLLLKDEKQNPMVCVIPVNQEISLKTLASQSGCKKCEMVHLKELLGLTGYIRGGCSPIGMKKLYPTFVENSALSLSQIGVSGGKRGIQILLSPQDLIKITNAKTFDNK